MTSNAILEHAVSPGTSDDFITLARVVKTQGRRGEVAAEVHSNVPERFREGMRLFALTPVTEETRRELQVEELWPHKELVVLKFRGVDSISEAESLVRCELQLPRSERAELESGWNYISDLVGCSVLDHGIAVGRIEDVQFGAGEAPLLIVADGSGRKFDIPFAEAYLEDLDLASKRVRMNLPEGMLEINAPVTNEEKMEQTVAQQERSDNHRGHRGSQRSSRRTPSPLR